MLSVSILHLLTLTLTLTLPFQTVHCHSPNSKDQASQLSKLFANFERISPYLGILGKPEPESSAGAMEKYAKILQGRQTSLRALATVSNEEQVMKHLREVCTEASNSLAKEPVKRVREAKEGLERLFNASSSVSSKKMREDAEFEKDLKIVAELFLNPRLFTEASNLDLLAKVARRQQQRLGNLKPANAEAFELVRAVLKGQDPHCTKESPTCPRCLVENLQIPKYCDRLKDLAKTDKSIEQAHAQQNERYSRVVSDLGEILRDYSSSDADKQVSKDASLAAKFAQIIPIWNLYKSSKYFDKANEPAYEYLSTLSKAEFLHLRDQLQKEISKTSSDKDKSNTVTMQQKKIMADLVAEIDGVSKRIAHIGNRTPDTENAELIEKLHSLKRRLVEKEAAYESSMKMSRLYQDKVTTLFNTKDAMNATQLDNLVRKIAQIVLPSGYSTKARGEIPIEAVRKHLEHLRPDSVELQGNSSARNSRINPYAHNERIREIDANKKQLLDELDVLMRVSYKIFDILRKEGDLATHNTSAVNKLMQEKADEIIAKKHALRVAFVEAALDERLLKEHGLYPVQSEHSQTVKDSESTLKKKDPESTQKKDHENTLKKDSEPGSTLKNKDFRPSNEDEFDYDNDDDDDDFDDDDDEDSQWEKSELIKEKGDNANSKHGKKGELSSRPSEKDTASSSKPSIEPKDKVDKEAAKNQEKESNSRPSVSDKTSSSAPSVDKGQAQLLSSALGTKEAGNTKDILSQLVDQYSNQDGDDRKKAETGKNGDSAKKSDSEKSGDSAKKSDSEKSRDSEKKPDSEKSRDSDKKPDTEKSGDSEKTDTAKGKADSEKTDTSKESKPDNVKNTDSETKKDQQSKSPSSDSTAESSTTKNPKTESESTNLPNPDSKKTKSSIKKQHSLDSEVETTASKKNSSHKLTKSHSLDSTSQNSHSQSSEPALDQNFPSKKRKHSQSARPKKCKEPEPDTSELANDDSFLPDNKNCDCAPISQMRVPNH